MARAPICFAWLAVAAAACGLGERGLESNEAPADAGSPDVFVPADDATTDAEGDAARLDANDANDPNDAGGPGEGGESSTGDGAPGLDGAGDDAPGDDGGNQGVTCGNAVCSNNQSCQGCANGTWTCTGCNGMPKFVINCDDWDDCNNSMCCVTSMNPVVTGCQGGPKCMIDHPLCDPDAATPCPMGTCQPADGQLGGTPYYNCR
jgi:hypothetical protein